MACFSSLFTLSKMPTLRKGRKNSTNRPFFLVLDQQIKLVSPKCELNATRKYSSILLSFGKIVTRGYVGKISPLHVSIRISFRNGNSNQIDYK